MIQGIGTDLVENERIRKIIGKWGPKFLQRIFSSQEIGYCESHAQAFIHYGARFAAKEAFLKALGIGLGRGVRFSEIEVVRKPNGKPDLAVHGGADSLIKKQKIKTMHLSITHTKCHSSAIVILEK